MRVAIYFSLLSTFEWGWRDFNARGWLSRMQRYEYTLRGSAWLRTLSGLQALISLYLFVLWALTFFGSPFE
jgi:hypothetical protein